MYLENVTCIENLEDAVDLSSDKLKAIVTLKSPVNCKYINVKLPLCVVHMCFKC